MAFAVENFQVTSQNYISPNIMSNFYGKLPFFAMLYATTVGHGNDVELDIGRPLPEQLAGKYITPADKIDFQDFNGYVVPIQRFETNNTVVLGKYPTHPVVANPTTTAHSQVGQAGAKFFSTDIETPILIWDRDLDRALNKSTRAGQGLAAAKVIERATKVALQEHIKSINYRTWNGNPTSQTVDPMDDLIGLVQAVQSTNTYGAVDRAVETTWAAKYHTGATTANLSALLDYANLDDGLRVYGNGADVMFCSMTNYKNFKSQAKALGATVVQNTNDVLKMGKYGLKQEALQIDNCLVTYDPTCATNSVFALSMAPWTVAFRPGRMFTVSPYEKLTGEGAKLAKQAFIRTEMILACENPGLQVQWTAVS